MVQTVLSSMDTNGRTRGGLPGGQLRLWRVCRITSNLQGHFWCKRKSLLLKMKTESPCLNSDLHWLSGIGKIFNGWMAFPSWETGNDGPACRAWSGLNKRVTHTGLTSMNTFFSYYIQGVEEHFKWHLKGENAVETLYEVLFNGYMVFPGPMDII